MRTLCARLSRTLIFRCLNNTQRNSLNFVSRYGKARKYGTVYELGSGGETTKLPRLKTSPAFDYISMSAAIPEKVPQTENVDFKPQKAGGILRIPTEIDQDAIINLGIFVADYAAREMARFEDVVLFTADGSATYKLMKGAGKYAVDLGRKVVLEVGNTSPADITLADLRAMRAQVDGAALINGAYYFHPSMDSLFVSFNAGRHDAPVYVRTGPDGGILENFPVRFVEVLPVYDTSAHAGQIQGVFGDLSYMYLAVKPGVVLQSSKDAFFTTDEIAVRALERFCVNQMADAAIAAIELAAE